MSDSHQFTPQYSPFPFLTEFTSCSTKTHVTDRPEEQLHCHDEQVEDEKEQSSVGELYSPRHFNTEGGAVGELYLSRLVDPVTFPKAP